MALISIFRKSAVLRRDKITIDTAMSFDYAYSVHYQYNEGLFSGIRRIRNYLCASQTQHRMSYLIALTLNHNINAQISQKLLRQDSASRIKKEGMFKCN